MKALTRATQPQKPHWESARPVFLFPFVFGKCEEEDKKNIRGVLRRLKEDNIRLKKDKCEFFKTEINSVVTSLGLVV